MVSLTTLSVTAEIGKDLAFSHAPHVKKHTFSPTATSIVLLNRTNVNLMKLSLGCEL